MLSLRIPRYKRNDGILRLIDYTKEGPTIDEAPRVDVTSTATANGQISANSSGTVNGRRSETHVHESNGSTSPKVSSTLNKVVERIFVFGPHPKEPVASFTEYKELHQHIKQYLNSRSMTSASSAHVWPYVLEKRSLILIDTPERASLSYLPAVCSRLDVSLLAFSLLHFFLSLINIFAFSLFSQPTSNQSPQAIIVCGDEKRLGQIVKYCTKFLQTDDEILVLNDAGNMDIAQTIVITQNSDGASIQISSLLPVLFLFFF